MNHDEVRAVIGTALDDEPPVGLDYETVLAAGRRRQSRRRLGVVAGAVLGVMAVAGAGVAVVQQNASRATDPANQITRETGCGGVGMSGGSPSQEELAESARLTEAFSKFAFPALPSGVSMAPAKRRFCTVTTGWQATIALKGPKGYRSLFIDVEPRQGQPAGECGVPDAADVDCSVISVKDTAVIRKTISPALRPNDPVRVDLVAWREDGTIVRLLETGAERVAGAVPRIMSDEDLLKIAIAPELKVNWTGSGGLKVAEPSDRRAAELTRYLQKAFVLPQGMSAVPMPEAKAQAMEFYPSPGSYKLNADLIDGKGRGNLFIVLSPPPPTGHVVAGSCERPNCVVVDLDHGRTGFLRRSSNGPITRIQLDTSTTDGGQMLIMVSNQSAAAGRMSGPSRTEPPLNSDDLIRIANAAGLG